MSDATNLYEQERRQKMSQLRELGVDPFGHRVEELRPLDELKGLFRAEMGHDAGPVVRGAGRILLKRDMGKLSFITLRDASGDLQVGLDKKRLSERDWQIRNLLDLGDQIVVEGSLGTTNKGETTIWASRLEMASKALLPPPAKWEGLSDVELRYRHRYVDLWANPEVMKLAKLRIAVIDEVRQYLRAQGYVEVETPMMQPIAGGAAARPFVTHHNALDIPLYLRIAPELYLKRLLVGGFTKVFELNRNFRNEGISPRHNPEFTMLEAYEAYGSWETMADLVEGMICHIAEKLFGGLKIVHRRGAEGAEKVINLTRPWRRVRMVDLVAERSSVLTGEIWNFNRRDIRETSPAATAALIRHRSKSEYDALGGSISKPSVEHEAGYFSLIKRFCEALSRGEGCPDDVTDADRTIWSLVKTWWQSLGQYTPAQQLVEFYEKLIEPTLIDPCYVTHVPSVIIPLAKENKEDPYFADVYELAINGQEISPGYTELNDPDTQAKHFAHQVGDDQQKTDDDFLTALKYGMPPAGGLGLGIDRLIMMLTGAESIRDVILFPLMKPHG